MAATSGVDEDDVVVISGSIGNGVFSDVGSVFAVAFFVEVDFGQGFTLGEFF